MVSAMLMPEQAMMEIAMNLVSRLQYIVGLLLVALLLGACEQPAPVSEAEAPAAEAAGSNGVASVDADGNIAPFGFASRMPVDVDEPMPAAPPPLTAANSELFSIHCVACHGADANGVEGLGVSLTGSSLVANFSETDLVAFLSLGRPADSPDNTTGVPMPAFSWMESAQLDELAVYLKSLQQP
jgi:mono/diheme cytochrome c family protein